MKQKKGNTTGKIMMAVMGAMLAGSSMAAASAYITPYDDVPQEHWSYASVQQLAKDGVIREAVPTGVMTRQEMAVFITKSLSKYDTASIDDKAVIDQLRTEYSEDLKAIGVRARITQNNVSVHSEKQGEMMTKGEKEKLSRLPNFRGQIKSYYYYKSVDGDGVMSGSGQTGSPHKARKSHLYQDIRGSLYGDINKQWMYEFDFLYRPNEGPEPGAYNDYRSVLNVAPGVATNGAWMLGRDVLGKNSAMIIGYQWIGIRNDNWVYNNGLKGITLTKKFNGTEVTGQWGVLDLVYNHGFSDENTAYVGSVNGRTPGNTYLGCIGWLVKDHTNNHDYKIVEAQIRQPLGKDFELNISGGKANEDIQNKFFSFKISKGVMDSQVKGSSCLYADYHYLGQFATLGPDGDRGISNAVGLRGIRIGYDFATAKGVQWRLSFMPWDRQISDGKLARVFNSSVYIDI